MFTQRTLEEAIGECFAQIKNFDDEYNGRAKNKFVRICIAGVDGGGLSTYGKSTTIEMDDVYEFRSHYLYIHRRYISRDHNMNRIQNEKTLFIPYESIIAVECCPEAYI